MGNARSNGLGWADAVAAALAVGIATVAAPSPARSAEEPVGPQLPAESAAIDAPAPLIPDLALPEESADPNYSFETQSVALRFSPSVVGVERGRPSVTLRNDHWNLVDIDGVARLSAFSRGALVAEDAALVNRPASLPRQSGTGFGLVTETPVYLGAAVRTDRSIYDFEMSRFRGARWTSSLFIGTDTALGPLYLGTNREPDGSRATYLYLGRWF